MSRSSDTHASSRFSRRISDAFSVSREFACENLHFQAWSECLLTAADVAALSKEFLSFREIGLHLQLSWPELSKVLTDNNIHPVFETGAIYHRQDLQKLRP